jgi:hypothetical protein
LEKQKNRLRFFAGCTKAGRWIVFARERPQITQRGEKRRQSRRARRKRAQPALPKQVKAYKK